MAIQRRVHEAVKNNHRNAVKVTGNNCLNIIRPVNEFSVRFLYVRYSVTIEGKQWYTYGCAYQNESRLLNGTVNKEEKIKRRSTRRNMVACRFGG